MNHQFIVSAVLLPHFHYVILTKIFLQSKTVLNFNNQNCSLIILLILKTKTLCQIWKQVIEKVTIKSTSKHQYYKSKTLKSNSYLTSTSTNNDTSSDKFMNTKYERYEP